MTKPARFPVNKKSPRQPEKIRIFHRNFSAGIPTAVIPTVIILAGILVFANSFPGRFVFDDLSRIVDNPQIRTFWPPWPYLKGSNRPLVELSFAFNYALGKSHPWGYHAFNLTVHILAALVFFGIVRRSLLSPSLKDRYRVKADLLAGVSALLWLIHPLQTASVTYVFQRAEAMMGLFYLMTFYIVIRYIERPRWPWFLSAVLACLGGMASKAVMVTAPVAIMLYDRIFFAGIWRAVWRKRGGLYLALAMTWGLLLITLGGLHRSRGTVGFDLPQVSVIEYALTQPGVILYYLWLALCPHPLVLDYGWPVERDPFVISVSLGAVVALLGLIVGGWRRFPRTAFLGSAFFLVLLPTSSLIPIADLIFEHRMYLPLAPLMVLLVIAGDWWSERVFLSERHRSVAMILSLAVIFFILAGLTIRRNSDYHDEVKIWRQTLQAQPGNPRAYYNLALNLMDREKNHEALEHLRQAVKLKPDYAMAHNNLGNLLYRQADVAGAKSHYEAALLADSDNAEAHNNYAILLMDQGQFAWAEKHLRESIRCKIRNPGAFKNLGDVFLLQGKNEEALAAYLQALAQKPDYPLALKALGDLYFEQGNLEAARSVYAQAIQLKGRDPALHNNLGVVFLRSGQYQKAKAHFQKALEINPDYEAARRNLQKALVAP